MMNHRQMSRLTILSVVGAAALAAVSLAACSNTTQPTTSPSSPMTGATSATPTTSGSSVLPPIPITKAEDVTVKVGAFLNVVTPNVTKVTTDNPQVLEVSQPHSDGSATFNGGARVLAPGKAILTVYGGITNSPMYSVNVTVIPR